MESTQWAGKVPLVLLDAREAIRRYLDKSKQDDYWKRPEVRPDIQAAFDRFLELNPDATAWYHNYAWYAYRCQRWDELNELIPKLGRVNYGYFGGRNEHDKMVRLAQEHGGDTLPEIHSLAVESKRLTARIASKMNQGKDTEEDFEPELKRCDTVLAEYKDIPQRHRELAGHASGCLLRDHRF